MTYVVLTFIATAGAAWVTQIDLRDHSGDRLFAVPVARADTTIDSDLPHDDYSGIEILKDIRVVDLRSRRAIPRDEKNSSRISPVTWTRYTLLKRVSEDREFVDFEFATTGFDVDPQCLSHKAKIIESDKPHFHGSRQARAKLLRVDIRREPLGREFLIVTEATFWNAFAGEIKEWASMHAQQDEAIGLGLLFPAGKPFRSFQVYEYRETAEREVFNGPSWLFQSENKQVLFWRIENARGGHVYEVEWEW